MATRIAAPAERRVVPAFVVKSRDDKVKRDIIAFDAKGKKYTKTIEEPYGYEVYFPMKKHSIRVRTDADLERLELDRTIPLIDTKSDDDEAVGEIDNPIKFK